MSLTRGTVALAILLASGAAPARSQTTFASITGTAVDPTGAIISGAKVTVTSVETGIASEAMTNETGNFTIPQLKEGTYELRAQSARL